MNQIPKEWELQELQLKKARKEIQELKDALVWCSGSQDFLEGGKAREGWDKLKHLIK